MSPAQSAMIMRKLEKMEAAQTAQAKQIKALERDNDIITQRVKALGEENVQLARAVESADKMITQMIRRG